MDSNGMSIAFNIFSGGESEKINMLPAIRRTKRNLDIERIIVVADKKFKDWVLDQNGKRAASYEIYQKQMVYYSEKYEKKAF